MRQPGEIFTFGHSTHGWSRFVELLKSAEVTAIADVRSSPYSRHTPQFDQKALVDSLRREGIAYVFLGRELGGRPRHTYLFSDGVADYEKMASVDDFRAGLARVIEGSSRFRISLMCTERDPLDCHRCLLVSRRLAERGIAIRHLLADGEIEGHSDTEERLLASTQLSHGDLLATRAERLIAAYRHRSRQVAFTEPSLHARSSVPAQ